jgi:DNA-directed RNA polymerase subunit E'/Rpb7
VLLSVGLIPENELSRIAGIEIDRKTNGPYVNESMETSIPGIFACGNVVHVHDVVDFVTEESRRAGINAARYVKGEVNSESEYMNIVVSGGITYCVPQKIRYSAMPDKLDLFMRVNDKYDEARIVITNRGNKIAGYKKKHLTPGEMIKQKVMKSLFQNAQEGDIEISLDVGGTK